MKLPEWLRLGLLSLLVLVMQQAMLLAHPEWRTGADVYIVWLLIVSSARGVMAGAVLALLGGMVMDSASGSFGMFHMLFYLLPVAIGALFTAHLITEYNLLAGLITGGLLLLKLLLLLIVALAAGWLPSAAYIFKLNYLPLLVCCFGVFILWQRIVRLVPPQRTIGAGVGFER